MLNETHLSQPLHRFKMPELVQIAPKLMPLVTEFNNYRYFLLEGGRNGMKSQTVARFLLHLGDLYKLNIVCGREVQNKIEESVYTLLVELIRQYDLPYQVFKDKIVHRRTGTKFTFRGFQDLTAEDIKGLQGIDILWVDEAQALKKRTVQVIIPTIRKETAKMIFTMNRFMMNDAVYEEFSTRPDCLHLYVTYLDNPWLPASQLLEAEKMKLNHPKDYNHVWLGHPIAAGEDFLFNMEKLHSADKIEIMGDMVKAVKVLTIDFAAQGGDKCVAGLLERQTSVIWKLAMRQGWREADAMSSIGRIAVLIGTLKPDLVILDTGGMGHVVWNRMIELGFDVKRFDGGSTELIDSSAYANARAEGYFTTAEWIENGWLMIGPEHAEVIKQFERIRIKYRSSGQRLIRPKEEYRADYGESPDDADMVMMGVWCVLKYLNKVGGLYPGVQNSNVVRVSKSRRPNMRT